MESVYIFALAVLLLVFSACCYFFLKSRRDTVSSSRTFTTVSSDNTGIAGIDTAVDLGEQIEFYSSLTEQAKDAFVSIDGNSNILVFNNAAERLFGWTKEEAIGNKVSIIIPQNYKARHIKNVTDHVMTGYPQGAINRTMELTAVKKNGVEFPVELSLSNASLRNKAVFTAVIRDISERKEAELKLKEAYDNLKELSKIKDDIISITGHELRTPLSSVLGYSEFLLEKNLPEKERIEFATVIYDESRKLSHLITDLLDIKKLENHRMKFYYQISDINEILASAIAGIKPEFEKKDISFSTNYLEQPPEIYVDFDRITQVFTNILNNAIKYTSFNGNITVNTTAEGEFIFVTVKDNGIGIHREELEKIFKTFERGSNCAEIQGSGIGLTLSKMIVEKGHNGTITADSEGHLKGTTITVQLPIAHSNLYAAQTTAN